jgi:hypothetical protein
MDMGRVHHCLEVGTLAELRAQRTGFYLFFICVFYRQGSLIVQAFVKYTKTQGVFNFTILIV